MLNNVMREALNMSYAEWKHAQVPLMQCMCAGHLQGRPAAPPQGQPPELPTVSRCIRSFRAPAPHHICRLPSGTPQANCLCMMAASLSSGLYRLSAPVLEMNAQGFKLFVTGM